MELTVAPVCIGIPTRDRPGTLAQLLDSLEVTIREPQLVSVVVVDNSSDRSARSAVLLHSGKLSIDYHVESRPGVVYVRNKILDIAAEKRARYVAFLDDDQVASHKWFEAMSDMSAKFPEDILTGPVIYDLDPATPPAIRDGGYFATRELPAESLVSMTGTGNTWIPCSLLARLPIPQFDERFGRSGGEDTEFIHRLKEVGGVIRWCPEAGVREAVPAARATTSAIQRRLRSVGYSNALIRMTAESRRRVFLAGCLRVGVGAAKYLARRLQCRPLRLRDVATFWSGLGYLNACLSREPDVYGKG